MRKARSNGNGKLQTKKAKPMVLRTRLTLQKRCEHGKIIEYEVLAIEITEEHGRIATVLVDPVGIQAKLFPDIGKDYLFFARPPRKSRLPWHDKRFPMPAAKQQQSPVAVIQDIL